ncbi:ABC transporter permease [Arcicella rosea]|uniref:ABC-type antimicrobial peptide transport system permease subunit n=1 Tax=Arcicella rosea TaxID=502909 RepID=A0A841EPZ1_9BACT|nr:ABC transporter permease [Arcicella rosea]MBB6005315.1 ABC-type antimicrobial peptide transport system permease subunit [Arcicella rosea]
MLQNYFKIALRTLLRNKAFSAINIVGLSVGMAVAMLIGLWIFDEISFDKYHQKYDRLAQVMQNQTWNGVTGSQTAMPLPLAPELRAKYSGDFKNVVLSSWNFEHILAVGDRKFTKTGNFVEPKFPEMFSFKMLKGSQKGLKDPYSILISESVATALFGDTDPINKIIKVDNKTNVKVTGVYEDLPHNTTLSEVTYVLPWEMYLATESWVKNSQDQWNNNSFQTFAELNPNADFDKVSAKIRLVKFNHDKQDAAKPMVFLHPMSKWHLYSEFKDGKIAGGRIQFVWLFGIIGVFVLLLACINFMNLSTARSEKRAKEVGVRKAIGSVRSQLITQFLSESLLIVVFAFVLTLVLVTLTLPWFNELSDKKMSILWTNPYFWILSISFSLITGLVSGSYPAFYLSSFDPIRVLKGTFRVGRFAAVPRKVLVVIQFTVSVTLIIGTIIVYRQIQHAKNRPIGYSRDGLIAININTPELVGHYDALRSDLLKTGAVYEMSQSSSPTTAVYSNQIGFNWEGKDPNLQALFGVIAVSHDYAKSVGWQFVEGRDFSRSFSTDTSAMILNEAASKFIGMKNPVGKNINWNDKNYRIVGVIKNMVMESPYEPIKPTIFFINYGWANIINVKLNPAMSASASLEKVGEVFRRYNPGSPFDYKFADEQYALKFSGEERIGKLATFFACLAIFISCLGIFGLASFTAEQRTKEIGVRKVLGASIFNLWQLLSKDFVMLVMISFLIATPIAYYFMNGWLKNYEYRSEISWWIFAASGFGALIITLLTVSYQAVKAASANPVKSLRTE